MNLWREGDASLKASNIISLFILQVQWGKNGGKCGVCGDDYSAAFKRHEVGGPFATGFITETYSQGQVIDVLVELTAAHKGKFFFRVCKQLDESVEVTQECLNQNQLKVHVTY